MRKYDPLKPRLDVHEAITAKIVAAIEAGAGEFQMPWHRPGISFTIPKNALTQKAYRGTNILSLWIDADEKKFEHQVWATFKQWQELGAQVRKGEKSSLIVKYGEWIPKDAREQLETDADEDSAKRLYAKAAHVFNVAQVDGFEIAPAVPRPDLTVRLAHVDAFLANAGVEFREGGQRAFYRRRAADGSGDFVQMPPRNLFTGTATCTPTEAYESTRLHEGGGHWTGAEHRLNRVFGERFGDKAYAFEELVAELAAAFLCAELGITNSPRLDHAQYIAHWLEVLKDDKKAIFTAAGHASRAVEYMFSLQPPAPAPGPDDAIKTGAAEPVRPEEPPGDADVTTEAAAWEASRAAKTTRHEIVWANPNGGPNGSTVQIRITHERDYLGSGADHLTIESIAPAKAPFPLTDTGYLSHFIGAAELEAAGGAEAYVTAWLARESQSEKWRRKDQVQRQGSLFDWAGAGDEFAERPAPASAKPKRITRARLRRPRDRTPE
jgi:antirestriction protein ArdC